MNLNDERRHDEREAEAAESDWHYAFEEKYEEYAELRDSDAERGPGKAYVLAMAERCLLFKQGESDAEWCAACEYVRDHHGDSPENPKGKIPKWAKPEWLAEKYDEILRIQESSEFKFAIGMGR